LGSAPILFALLADLLFSPALVIPAVRFAERREHD
jgi:hypothetical protein